MTVVFAHSSVLLDVLTEDARRYDRSAEALETHAESSVLAINPTIYPEVSIRFESIEDLEEAIPPDLFQRAQLPWEAGFLAGKCFVRHRRKGGVRRSPLPDFYIGAHAAVRGWKLLTRDAAQYHTYFPGFGFAVTGRTTVSVMSRPSAPEGTPRVPEYQGSGGRRHPGYSRGRPVDRCDESPATL